MSPPSHVRLRFLPRLARSIVKRYRRLRGLPPAPATSPAGVRLAFLPRLGRSVVKRYRRLRGLPPLPPLPPPARPTGPASLARPARLILEQLGRRRELAAGRISRAGGKR